MYGWNNVAPTWKWKVPRSILIVNTPWSYYTRKWNVIQKRSFKESKLNRTVGVKYCVPATFFRLPIAPWYTEISRGCSSWCTSYWCLPCSAFTIKVGILWRWPKVGDTVLLYIKHYCSSFESVHYLLTSGHGYINMISLLTFRMFKVAEGNTRFRRLL